MDVRLARVYRRDGRILEAVQTYEQQLGQPWYRLYYDTRVHVVVTTMIEPAPSPDDVEASCPKALSGLWLLATRVL